MGINNIVLKTAKNLFKSPMRPNAKLYEQIPMNLGFAYTGVNMYKAVDNMSNHKNKEANENLTDALAGMAAIVGSMFGFGGAVILGGGMKLLGDNAKPYLV